MREDWGEAVPVWRLPEGKILQEGMHREGLEQPPGVLSPAAGGKKEPEEVRTVAMRSFSEATFCNFKLMEQCWKLLSARTLKVGHLVPEQ